MDTKREAAVPKAPAAQAAHAAATASHAAKATAPAHAAALASPAPKVAQAAAATASHAAKATAPAHAAAPSAHSAKAAAPTTAPAAKAAAPAATATAAHAHAASSAAAAKKTAAPKKKKAPAAKKAGIALARGKRKESVARAIVSKGKGSFRVNSIGLSALSSRYAREIISEPMRFVPELAPTIDVDVEVYGGGSMGQAQACRTAVAKALLQYTNDDALKQRMLQHDRSLLVEDSRRVEPKKYKGPKARARFQKSYR